MAMPVAGIVIFLIIVAGVALWKFPKLVKWYDKAHDHFDLKDEDYEPKEEINEGDIETEDESED